MSILITGGAGFIGSNFVLDLLTRSGEPLLNLDNHSYAGNIENLQSHNGNHLHVFMQGHIGDSARVPEYFAHGFVVISETAEFLYKTTDYYAPQHERCIAWNDSTLKVDWSIEKQPSLSGKDEQGQSFINAAVFA